MRWKRWISLQTDKSDYYISLNYVKDAGFVIKSRLWKGNCKGFIELQVKAIESRY